MRAEKTFFKHHKTLWKKLVFILNFFYERFRKRINYTFRSKFTHVRLTIIYSELLINHKTKASAYLMWGFSAIHLCFDSDLDPGRDLFSWINKQSGLVHPEPNLQGLKNIVYFIILSPILNLRSGIVAKFRLQC